MCLDYCMSIYHNMCYIIIAPIIIWQVLTVLENGENTLQRKCIKYPPPLLTFPFLHASPGQIPNILTFTSLQPITPNFISLIFLP